MEETYTVLYYKRKNKVHKSKGVSKKDGILTTDKKSLIVSLMDDGNQVFRGIHREIASKTSLQVDDIIVLGSYEVEILSHEDSAAAGTSTKPQTKQPLQRKIAPKTSFFRGPLHPKASRPLTAAAAAAAASPSTTHRSSVATKRILYRPPQPIKATPNYESSSSSSSSSSDEESSKFERKLEKENLLTARASAKRPPPVSSSTTTRLPPFKKHIRTIVPSIKNSNGLTKPPQKPLGIRPFTKTPPHPSSGDFLGAVGKINLPHSIKSVLKPHQVEGVTFLWNCLTGNNKANIVSPHVPNHQVFKGAILADEMGLGKTLMTIATICALFRQNRSSVRECSKKMLVPYLRMFDKPSLAYIHSFTFSFYMNVTEIRCGMSLFSRRQLGQGMQQVVGKGQPTQASRSPKRW